MFHEQLKKETSALHKELDQLPVNKRIMSSTVTFNEYKLFLLAHFHVYEFLINAYNTDEIYFFSDINDRFIAVKNDLSKLNVNTDKEPFIEFPQEKVNVDKATLLGLQYVIEGSRHGAFYIKKHLVKQLQLSDETLAFLSYTPKVDWKNLIQTINTENDTFAVKKGSAYAYNLFIISFKALSKGIDE